VAISTIKVAQIAGAALGILQRELTLPRLVWRDAVGDFRGALNDTISIRVPAYLEAHTRALRSGDTRNRNDLNERKVDVTLTTDVYKDVAITDEELTLDIVDFGQQVLNPVMQAVARKVEDALITTVSGATYANTITFTAATDDAWDDIILAAREYLNKANVPMTGRVLAVGSGIDRSLLRTDLFVKANESGGTDALSEARVSRKGGFDIVVVPGLPPNEAYAFHQTAFVMVNRAPIVPAGAPWGIVRTFDGLALRAVQILDSDAIVDILAVDSWVGSNVVTDDGYFDANGVFQPSSAALGSTITLATSAASDDIIDTAAAHGLVAGDTVTFPTLTGGAGLTANTRYYVVATSLGAQTFRVALTEGGTPINFTTDITAGTAREGGGPLLVRAVKIVQV
jgi:hypothetical protein